MSTDVVAALDRAQPLTFQVDYGDPRRSTGVCRQRMVHHHRETEERQKAVDYLPVDDEVLTRVHGDLPAPSKASCHCCERCSATDSSSSSRGPGNGRGRHATTSPDGASGWVSNSA